ncbi:MAG: hypothetical protein DRJ03_03535 [Chloroflexi bacterium]|nr:MAG: hypothetical protein DRJ03_03535 [Chloroflexota bacterium]
MTIPTTALDETSPAGSDNISQGDNRIREFKTQMREIGEVDHKHESSGQDADMGKHKKVTLLNSTTVSAGIADQGILYVKDVSGKAELFYMDEDDNEIQLTNGGVLNYAVTGDWQISSVTTARNGWTNVTATYADKFMRFDATPLGTGGADAHTHTGPSHTHTGPSHTHTVPANSAVWGTTTATAGKLTTGQDGGNSASTAAATSASGTGNTGASGTGNTGSSSNVPAYIEVAVFQKD